MKSYINSGGSVLLLVGEGGESKWGTNVNYFLEEYGIWVNSDAVVRSSYLKYMHPKVKNSKKLFIPRDRVKTRV